MKIKKFENFKSSRIINWPSDIKETDINRYEEIISEIISLNELEEKMEVSDELLQEIENDYPDYYDILEDEIKELTLY